MYQAPELLGLLPRELAGTPQSYPKNVDIWAVVHEVLTSEILFLEPAAIADSFMDSSASTMSTVSVDMDGLFNYCRGRPISITTLQHHGIGSDGINFVTSLMTANPMGRGSATDALKHNWLGGNPSCDATFDQPPQRRPADCSRIMALTEPAANKTSSLLPPRNNSAAPLARPAVSPPPRSLHLSPADEGQSPSQTGSPVVHETPPHPPGVRAVTRAPVKPGIQNRSVPCVLYWRLRLITGSRLAGYSIHMESVGGVRSGSSDGADA